MEGLKNVDLMLASPILSCDSELYFENLRRKYMRCHRMEPGGNPLFPPIINLTNSLKKKYGITSRKSPKKSCVRPRHGYKTSTPRASRDVTKHKRKSKRSSSPRKSMNKYRNGRQTFKNCLITEKLAPRHSSPKLPHYLRIWDKQLSKIKQKTQELKTRDELIKKRYEQVMTRAENVMRMSLDETLDEEDRDSCTEKKNNLHSDELSGHLGYRMFQDSSVTEKTGVNSKQFQVYSNTCNINIYRMSSHRDQCSPLKTVFKNGRRCTFC